jgi:hypothetical protein
MTWREIAFFGGSGYFVGMEVPFGGGCLCGEVRYECASAPLLMLNCHCRDCQQVSGGPYAPVVVVRLKDFKTTKGAVQHFAAARLNGRQNLRGFCAKCGSHLTLGEDPERGIIGLMASGLDDPARFKPAMDIFVCDAQQWDVMDANLPKHLQYPPRK